MSCQEKATELLDKFGSSALNQVEDTINTWTIKKNYAEDNRGLDICKRTLIYWNKVKDILTQGL